MKLHSSASPGLLAITAYDAGSVAVNGRRLTRSFLLTPQRLQEDWPPASLEQITPADLQWVRIADLPTYTSITRWSLLPIADKPVVILRNSMEQQLEHTGTDIQWASVVEDGFGMFNRNDPTKVTITEPGLYHIDASLQWNPQVVPDVAHAVVVVNNQETEMRDSKYMRGGLLFQPGFSQSLNMSGKIRLSIGDVITLRAKYTAAGPLLGEIFSWFDAPSRVNSRFEMSYLSV